MTGQRKESRVRNEGTRCILVLNIPSYVTGKLLSIFFESTKNYGGGPVKAVHMMEYQAAAVVEFMDACAVQIVLQKKPIIYGDGKTILQVWPFSQSIVTIEDINRINLHGEVKWGLVGQPVPHGINANMNNYTASVALQPTYIGQREDSDRRGFGVQPKQPDYKGQREVGNRINFVEQPTFREQPKQPDYRGQKKVGNRINFVEQPTFREQPKQPDYRGQKKVGNRINFVEQLTFREQPKQPDYRGQREVGNRINFVEQPTFREQPKQPDYRGQKKVGNRINFVEQLTFREQSKQPDYRGQKEVGNRINFVEQYHTTSNTLSVQEIAEKMKRGSRVVRGRDWCDGDKDGGGVGKITSLPFPHISEGFVHVRWDNVLLGDYRMGLDGRYELDLVP